MNLTQIANKLNKLNDDILTYRVTSTSKIINLRESDEGWYNVKDALYMKYCLSNDFDIETNNQLYAELLYNYQNGLSWDYGNLDLNNDKYSDLDISALNIDISHNEDNYDCLTYEMLDAKKIFDDDKVLLLLDDELLSKLHILYLNNKYSYALGQVREIPENSDSPQFGFLQVQVTDDEFDEIINDKYLELEIMNFSDYEELISCIEQSQLTDFNLPINKELFDINKTDEYLELLKENFQNEIIEALKNKEYEIGYYDTTNDKWSHLALYRMDDKFVYVPGSNYYDYGYIEEIPEIINELYDKYIENKKQ